MGSDMKTALMKANLVTEEQARIMREQDDRLRSHAKRQMEMRRNVSDLETFLTTRDSAQNRLGQRLAYIRWYLGQRLPRNLKDLCFFCGEEGMHEFEVAVARAAMKVSCELAGVSGYEAQLEIAAISSKLLTAVPSYLELIEMPEDIRDFCYSLEIQCCNKCWAFSAFSNKS